MKPLRSLLAVVLISLSPLAFAQMDAQKSVAQSDAQKSFDRLKTLAGTWEGPITLDPPRNDVKPGTLGQITMRVTSRGNAL
ncbi:MAG TPA: hypothetical protein VEF05_11480, partial [Terriglobales bacterium]|nr:hypothetical protein [Terriglobales bacterium]